MGQKIESFGTVCPQGGEPLFGSRTDNSIITKRRGRRTTIERKRKEKAHLRNIYGNKPPSPSVEVKSEKCKRKQAAEYSEIEAG